MMKSRTFLACVLVLFEKRILLVNSFSFKVYRIKLEQSKGEIIESWPLEFPRSLIVSNLFFELGLVFLSSMFIFFWELIEWIGLMRNTIRRNALIRQLEILSVLNLFE